jgi:hypothetical protein
MVMVAVAPIGSVPSCAETTPPIDPGKTKPWETVADVSVTLAGSESLIVTFVAASVPVFVSVSV